MNFSFNRTRTARRLLTITTVVLLATLTLLLASCDDEDMTTPVEENKTSGFVVNVQTPAETNLVKYFEEFPSGTIDLSDGKDFQRFFPNDAFDGALFLPNPDGSASFSRVVVNGRGEVVVDATAPVVDESSLRIKVKDAETGLFHDRNTPAQLTIFDPRDMSIKANIDMSNGLAPRPQRYQEFFFRENEVFASIRGNDNVSFDSTIVHRADLSSGTYLSTLTKNSGAALNTFGFGERAIDESGNIYVTDGGDVLRGNPIASILKIPSGSDVFDPGYDFNPALVANPSNTLLATFSGFKYFQNNQAFAIVATETPQALIDLVTSVGGNPANLSEAQVQQALGILFSAENGRWSVLDLQAQTVTPIEGVPNLSPFATSVILEANGQIYLPVTTDAENAYYSYDPATGQASKALDIVGGELIGIYNLANNN